MMIKLAAVCFLSAFAGAAIAACVEGEAAISKPGYYGAVNTEVYGEMDGAISSRNTARLSSLLTQRAVAQIPAGIEVCIIKADFFWDRKRIDVPGLPGRYWVDDAAVTVVR
ncbi:MAG: hypothetical protein KDH17_05405 [Rhodocyclaceae bacterium]|nr:hypothetical protein [Rhodocyclaceae bacterium]